ncbi:hypothetical protein Hokovirus_2_225 [Hokovirus HKV1]|uniref:Uncharacterized protein n=1 Tax=Hokovirus HKV1 TaxID=1977638 RepID=A0A1V0SGE5_9VIRU|nr:hypothetical protein Hokovirus_2_225 [Hokovirus HKV1]
MDYKSKYLKYKKKYIQTSNDNFNNKVNEIIKFLETENIKTIKNKLHDVINYKEYCPKILGEGAVGRAYIPEPRIIPYSIGKKIINLPIVVKECKKIDQMNEKEGLIILNNVLYINGYDDITPEALILMFIKKLIKKTVHLPLILGYGTCSNTKLITNILTCKYGLDKNITINLANKIFDENIMWRPKETTEIFDSNIATLKELFTYIHYSKQKDGSVILPNGIKCKNISKLFDYICISYFTSHYLLSKNNIYPSDMHSGNIFIHWLNDNSYYDDKNIKNLKNITYKINNKYYYVKTFGFVIILGDTGTFMINVKKNIKIIGHINDIKNNYSLINTRMNEKYSNMDFLQWNSGFLTRSEFNNTIVYNILNSEPYCSYPMQQYHLLGVDKTFINKFKSTLELLEFFDEKYSVKKYDNDVNSILISI